MSLIVIGIILLAVFGSPLFIVVGGIAFAAFYVVLDMSPATVFTDFYRLTSMPIFVAIPLFTFFGYLMAETRLPEKMLRFTNALLGWMPGGLCFVALIACSVFTAFTGASAITIVSIGTLLYPVFQKDNYPEQFTLGLITTSGSLGTLLIPCLPLILYGVIAGQQKNVSLNVENMFIASLLPVVLLITLLYGYSFFFGLKYSPPKKFSWPELGASAWDIKWELPLPVLVVGGIMSGFFSAPEAAAVAVFYALVVEMLITREMTPRKLIKVIRHSMIMKGAILMIVGMALGLTDVFVTLSIPDRLFELICRYITSRHVFLLVLNCFLVMVGCFMDMFSAIAVVVPIIVPIAVKYNVDPIHLGIIFLANLELGFLTPPVGMSLFISSMKFNKPLPTILKAVVPFVILLIIGLLMITYIPDLSLYLLNFSHKKTVIAPGDLL